jgi:uncharacterized protein HemX
MAAGRYLATAAVVFGIAFAITRFGFDPAKATPESTESQAAAKQPPQQPPGMQDMTKMHEQMMAEMKAGDARLDALVKDMNAAAGEKRVTAMMAVINELVRQHSSMHVHMGQMHEQMMAGRGRGRMMER